jgi:hypothetical protein
LKSRDFPLSMAYRAILFLILLLPFRPARTLCAEITPEQKAIHALDVSENNRESRLTGYSVKEHYSLHSNRFGLSAEMEVETVYKKGQGETYRVISRSGSSMLQSRVFDRLLQEEAEMTRGETRHSILATSDNYSMHLAGEDVQAGVKCYILELVPKVSSSHLLKGRAWTNQEDGSLIRIEGMPEKSPSSLSGRPMITREYQNVGKFWLVKKSFAVTSSFLLGKSDLLIEYSDYRLMSEEAKPASH